MCVGVFVFFFWAIFFFSSSVSVQPSVCGFTTVNLAIACGPTIAIFGVTISITIGKAMDTDSSSEIVCYDYGMCISFRTAKKKIDASIMTVILRI